MSLSPQQKKRKKQRQAGLVDDSQYRFRNVDLTERKNKKMIESIENQYNKHKGLREEKSYDPF